MQIGVYSEVGRLKAVMLHRPGRELERLAPDYLENMLFEDIPWVEKMSREHQEFAQILTETGCTVYYIEDLLLETLSQEPAPAEHLIEQTLRLCGLQDTMESHAIRDHLLSLGSRRLAETIITGLEKREIEFEPGRRPLGHYIRDDSPFYIPPLANLYFTRDPAVVIGNTLSINVMQTKARSRESALLGFLADYHPMLAAHTQVHRFQPHAGHTIEGGDVLVLTEHAVAVGCSARTSPGAIEQLAARLFEDGFSEVLAVRIPSARAYMHLDTVLTMVDRDAFTVFAGVEDEITVYRVTPGLTAEPISSLGEALANALGLDSVRLIRNADGDALSAAREQWNDSTNTLAVAPGKVITYNRNVNSNRELRNNGLEVIEIEGSELVRGRGGPRCMSMPLLREA